MIRLRGLRRSFHGDDPERGVLRGVDLDVALGELVAIVGPSGCGKTTLLNVVGGLDTAYRGTAEVDGRDLRSLSDAALADLRNRRIGFAFQALHLLDRLSAVDNVALPSLFARASGAPGARAGRARAVELLERVGLGGRGEDRPGELSGGERQRVALARALFNRPALLLCDELTGNLDRATGEAVVEVLREARQRDNVTVVVVTHDPDLVRAADRVLELADGRLRSVAAGEGR